MLIYWGISNLGVRELLNERLGSGRAEEKKAYSSRLEKLKISVYNADLRGIRGAIPTRITSITKACWWDMKPV